MPKSNVAKADARSAGEAGKGDAPKYDAFLVRENASGGKSHWYRIGAAWPHRDGKGLSVDLVPYGRVELREPRAPGEPIADDAIEAE